MRLLTKNAMLLICDANLGNDVFDPILYCCLFITWRIQGFQLSLLIFKQFWVGHMGLSFVYILLCFHQYLAMFFTDYGDWKFGNIWVIFSQYDQSNCSLSNHEYLGVNWMFVWQTCNRVSGIACRKADFPRFFHSWESRFVTQYSWLMSY